MDCRFDLETSGARHLIRVAGRLTAANVPELLDLWEQVQRNRSAGARVYLDLRDLLSVDDSGVETLVRITRAGTKLVDASPYIRMKLASSASSVARKRKRPRR